MKKFLIVLCLCAAGLGLTGCESHMYQWGGYQKYLLAYYKNNDKVKFANALEKIIIRAETNDKIPPGLYGEMGYMLYDADRFGDAVEYFEKEKNTWPESTIVMDKMIRNCANAGSFNK